MIGVNDWQAPNLSSPPLLPFMETQRNLLKLLSYEAFYDIYDKICICTILPVPVTQGKGWKVPAVRWWWICWCSIAQHLIDWYISRLNFFSLILMWPGPDMATKPIIISTYVIFSRIRLPGSVISKPVTTLLLLDIIFLVLQFNF